jgi:outer membrane protein insertion porin family
MKDRETVFALESPICSLYKKGHLKRLWRPLKGALGRAGDSMITVSRVSTLATDGNRSRARPGMSKEGKVGIAKGLRVLIVASMGLCAALAVSQEASLIKEIEVRGLQHLNREVVLTAMRAKVGQPMIQAQLDQDKRSIEGLGFFQAVDVRARELDAQSWQVVVEVVEFPLIKEVRVVGNSVIGTDKLMEVLAKAPSLPIAPGYVYNITSVSASVAAIKKLYAERGFFAEIEAFGPLPESPETINVSIVEATVNSVSVRGAERTKKWVLDKIIRTKAGDPFSEEKWINDVRRVYNTQWFESVQEVRRPTEELGKVDLIADVKETRTGLFNIGVQVDPRSSFAGLLRFSDSNFQGSGQSVGLSYLQGTAGGGASVTLDYGNPFYDDRGTSVQASLFSRVVYRFSGIGFDGSETPTENNRYFERRTGGTSTSSRPGAIGRAFSWSRVSLASLGWAALRPTRA